MSKAKPQSLPWIEELTARTLCQAACGKDGHLLVRCEIEPQSCPYWRQRLHLVRPLLRALGVEDYA